MANKRPEIRAAVKNMLNSLTVAGFNIYTNRENRLWLSELPAILIYTKEELAVREALQSKRYIRNLHLIIEAKVASSSSVDDELDNLVSSIEDLIEVDQSIGGTVLATSLVTTQTKVDSDSEQDIAVATLTYECQYIA